ncbi:MAG: RdgB/HAM1 family non-canonical purine NTP pyrophosphatase [Clostridiales bacterium]|nr:RdgB/HAM1 family non-canonical purine NTP pyrophosphatase [Clostridiales bacterium]
MENEIGRREILVVATGNLHKLTEIESILGDRYLIRPMGDYGIRDIEENGSSFEENAGIKARFVMERTGLCALADDSGLEVDALQGAPGIYSARYCGRHGDDAANNSLLLRNLSGMKRPWTARYVAAVALARPGKGLLVRRGTCEGEILDEYRGNGGFGYDPLFLCELGKTFAEISLEEKNRISHRKRGILAVLTALCEERA